jgi:hypothetical protein
MVISFCKKYNDAEKPTNKLHTLFAWSSQAKQKAMVMSERGFYFYQIWGADLHRATVIACKSWPLQEAPWHRLAEMYATEV